MSKQRASARLAGGKGPDVPSQGDPPGQSARAITRSVSRHYDRLTDSYVDAFFEDISDSPWVDRLLARLPAGARVLDAGCGPGRLSRYMVDQGYAVSGIDISPSMVQAARRLVPEADFAVTDMARLRYPARQFDGIFAAYSFFHLPPERVGPALQEFRRVLVPMGSVAFIVKRGQGTHVEASPLVPGETCYVQLWDDGEFAALLESHGFELLEQASAAPDSPEELPFERLFFLARVDKRAGATGDATMPAF